MLINFSQIIKDLKIEANGLIQVGAHIGQEVPLFLENGFDPILCFEPHSGSYKKLRESYKERVICSNYACGKNFEDSCLFVETTNNGQSNSLLKPKLHLKQYPTITFESRESVKVCPLDKFIEFFDSISNYPSKFNVLVVDVQGSELAVFKGATETLINIDCIFTEVNRAELYENCAQVDSVDAYLEQFGFKRIITNWAGNTWGDAVYAK